MAVPDERSTDPDDYAAELQDCLHCKGPRSREVRRLLRSARRQRSAELERIFETKLAEYQRYRRESRRPTIWNVPVRAWEWFWVGAQHTPPREVLMTLVYVALALVGAEAVKRYALPRFEAEVPQAAPEAFTDWEEGWREWDLYDTRDARRGGPNVSGAPTAGSAADTDRLLDPGAHEPDLASRVDAALETVLASPEFRARLRQELIAALRPDRPRAAPSGNTPLQLLAVDSQTSPGGEASAPQPDRTAEANTP